MTTHEPRLVDQHDAATRPVGWLGLAASPTFALMAWISAGDASQGMICSSAPGQLPITDMAWMYLLMSLFHLSPWLKHAHACSHQLPLRPKGD
jgi:hypothetical protein